MTYFLKSVKLDPSSSYYPCTYTNACERLSKKLQRYLNNICTFKFLNITILWFTITKEKYVTGVEYLQSTMFLCFETYFIPYYNTRISCTGTCTKI